MARTDRERFDGALKYVRTKIDDGLADDIARRIVDANAAGAAISLEGGGFWHSGSDDQHWALRALLLCHRAYLSSADAHPFVQATAPASSATAMRWFKGKSEAQVQAALRAYTITPGVSRTLLADVANQTDAKEGDFEFGTRTRDDDSLGANPVCFNAVRLWLFKAGYVSMRWLASEGYGLDANTCNRILGSGVEIAPGDLPRMPRGYMFNFHARRSPSTCHWGISLGDGYAVGSNTTARESGCTTEVVFRRGSSVYGEFPMAASYEVCRHKYKLVGETIGDVVVRQIDPDQVMSFF